MGTDLAILDATAQAELVRRRELTAAELVEAAIGRIEALNPTINAVIHTRFDEALAEAAAVDPEAATTLPAASKSRAVTPKKSSSRKPLNVRSPS